MERREIAVSFVLNEAEARLATSDIRNKLGVTGWTVTVRWTLAVISLACGPALVILQPRIWSGWVYLALGLYNFVATLQQSRGLMRLAHIAAGIETTMHFSEAGVSFERPVARLIPWSAVDSVQRSTNSIALVFDASAVQPPLERDVAVPRRELADGGAELWRMSERAMLGPLRRVSAQTSLDRSGALRRNDSDSIVNVESRRARTRAARSTIAAKAAGRTRSSSSGREGRA